MKKITRVEEKSLRTLGKALGDGEGFLNYDQISESGFALKAALSGLVDKGYVTATRDNGVTFYGLTDNGRFLAYDGVAREFLVEE